MNNYAGELGLSTPPKNRLPIIFARLVLEDVAALLTIFSRTQYIAFACRANLNPTLRQTVLAERLFKRRAKKARLLGLLVQVRSLGNRLVIDGGTTFLAHVPFVRVVSPANRTFNRIANLGLFVAPIAPDAACSAIGHIRTLSRDKTCVSYWAVGGFGAPGTGAVGFGAAGFGVREMFGRAAAGGAAEAAASLEAVKSAPHFWQTSLSGLLKPPHSMHLTAVAALAGL